MNNAQKAQAIYEQGGKSAIFDAVQTGTLKAFSWGYCSGCEDDTPADEDGSCLCCGLTVWGEIL